MEIPAGTKVKVAMTQKGETTVQDAEVLAHMDGLVHVNLNGEAISVDPSQIVSVDAPAVPAADPAAPVVDVAKPEDDSLAARVGSLESLTLSLQARIAALESRLPADGSAVPAEARVTALEARIPPEGGVVNPALAADPPAEAAPAEETNSNTNSTTVTDSGESAAGSN